MCLCQRGGGNERRNGNRPVPVDDLGGFYSGLVTSDSKQTNCQTDENKNKEWNISKSKKQDSTRRLTFTN